METTLTRKKSEPEYLLACRVVQECNICPFADACPQGELCHLTGFAANKAESCKLLRSFCQEIGVRSKMEKMLSNKAKNSIEAQASDKNGQCPYFVDCDLKGRTNAYCVDSNKRWQYNCTRYLKLHAHSAKPKWTSYEAKQQFDAENRKQHDMQRKTAVAEKWSLIFFAVIFYALIAWAYIATGIAYEGWGWFFGFVPMLAAVVLVSHIMKCGIYNKKCSAEIIITSILFVFGGIIIAFVMIDWTVNNNWDYWPAVFISFCLMCSGPQVLGEAIDNYDKEKRGRK